MINPSFPIGGGGSSVGEPIKEEQIEVNELENGVEWVISNPSKTNYTLEEDGIAINLSLDDKAEQWNISWTHLGDNHYQLVVKADGKTITKFKSLSSLRQSMILLIYYVKQVKDMEHYLTIMQMERLHLMQL